VTQSALGPLLSVRSAPCSREHAHRWRTRLRLGCEYGSLRECRLRPEFATLYSGVSAGPWPPASDMLDSVTAARPRAGRGSGEILRNRLLDERHFEFRGGHDPFSLAAQRYTRGSDLEPPGCRYDTAFQVPSLVSHPQTILVVEDEPAIRSLYVRVLREAGFQTAEATDGMEGLEMALARPYDLVVTNSRMPMLSGEQMVGALRRQRPHQAILHVSGSQGMTSQPDHLPPDVPTLCKPFSPETLVDAVRRTIHAPM
jgi:CheY-like chemotaxis protein